MNKNKFLTYSVVALFIINIITLSFFFFKKDTRPNERNRPRPKEIIIDKLDFDKQQIESFDKLIKVHKSSIEALDHKIKDSKNNLYQQLSISENQIVIDSILSTLNKYKSEIELIHFNHFLDIKKLCKPEQLDNYNDLTLELSKIFAPKGMPKKDE
jgi:periplasmic protein CpxP/Spy